MPLPPRNVTVQEVTSSSIKISWLEPEKANGVIHGYRIYYTFLNQTLLHMPSLKNDANSGPVYTYTLNNLSEYSQALLQLCFLIFRIIIVSGPYTDYKIIVQPYTLKNEGKQSDPILQKTDVSGPSAPIIVNLTCHTSDTLHLRFKRPTIFYNSIDFYIIWFKQVNDVGFMNITLNASSAHLETAVSIPRKACVESVNSNQKKIFQLQIPNLVTHSTYEVRVQAATISVINSNKLVLGAHSVIKTVGFELSIFYHNLINSEFTKKYFS